MKSISRIMQARNQAVQTKKPLSPDFIAFLLALFFFVISFLSMLGNAPTYDESLRYIYGKQVLYGDTTRLTERHSLDNSLLGGSDMPVTALNVIPEAAATLLPDGPLKIILQPPVGARTISILVSLLAAALVYRWSKSLYGAAAGLFSLALYSFDPNFIAHSQVVGTDVYSWTATIWVFYCGWKFAKERTDKNLLWLGVSLGLASVTKYSTILHVPLVFLCLLIYDLPAMHESWAADKASAIKKISGKYAAYIGIVAVVMTVIINAAFLFNRPFVKFAEYDFESRLFQNLQRNAGPLLNLPIPLPYPYLQGFDLTYSYGESGASYGNIYLLGELRDGTQGFKGYYFVVTFFKMPISTQLICLGALILSISSVRRRGKLLQEEIFLLLPSLFFTLYFNFAFNIHTGIRYYMIFFPLLYVLAGGLFSNWNAFLKLQKTVSCVLIAWLAASTLFNFPYYTAYFNEFLWDKTKAYKILADSNLDYGQQEYQLQAYLKAHPRATLDPEKPVSGLVVASVNNLLGVFGPFHEADRYAWLRDHFEPDDTIARTYLIYHISEEDVNKLCESASYCR